MKVGYIGKKEINSMLAKKPFTVHLKKTKSKTHTVYINEDIGLSADDVLNIANACGLSSKLSLDDGKMVFAFAKSLILSSRGHYEAN